MFKLIYRFNLIALLIIKLVIYDYTNSERHAYWSYCNKTNYLGLTYLFLGVCHTQKKIVNTS